MQGAVSTEDTALSLTKALFLMLDGRTDRYPSFVPILHHVCIVVLSKILMLFVARTGTVDRYKRTENNLIVMVCRE